jgi:serine/threonine protein kinase
MEAANGDCLEIENPCALLGSDFPSLFVVPWLQALKNVLLALANMHTHGFFHFDVKPANMLWFGSTVVAPEIAKLADFGECKPASELIVLGSRALRLPWFNFPPAACVAALLLQNAAKEQQRTGRQVRVSRGVHTTKTKSRDDDINARIQTCAAYWRSSRLPKFASLRATTAEGIAETAHSVASRLTPEELAAAIDLFGFALALAPLHRIAVIKPQITSFFNNALECQLSDTRALRAIDEMIVIASTLPQFDPITFDPL